jgi:hypothetical protein
MHSLDQHSTTFFPTCKTDPMTTPNPLNAVAEPDWPVALFRKTTNEWQNLQAYDGHGNVIPIRATPRAGSIVVKQLRLRFTLNATEKKSVVVRRNRSILVGSEDKPLVFVFQFVHDEACLEFSDYFVTLNPPTPAKPPPVVDRQTQLNHSSTGAKKEVLFYIARLLNDPGFQEYTDALETCLNENDDYAKMVQAIALKSKT